MEVTNGSAYDLKLSNEAAVFLVTIISLQIVIGSIANFIVILTIIATRQLRNRSEDRLILSLAVIDFSAVTTFLPWHCYYLIQGNISKPHYKFSGSLQTLVITGGGYAILAIAIDRFVAVVFPLRHRMIMTRRTTLIMALLSWGIGVVFAIVNYFRLSFILGYHTFRILFVTSEFSLQFGIVVLYSIIFYCTVKQSRTILNQRRIVGIEDHVNSSRRHFKTIYTTLAFMVLYCVTWLPLLIYATYAMALKLPATSNAPKVIWFESFVFLSSCANPFVYALRTKRFKAAFSKNIWSKMSRGVRLTGSTQNPRRSSTPSII